MRKSNILTALLLVVLCTVGLMVHAQAPPPSSNPPGAPVDVLAGLLLISGAGLGLLRLREEEE